MPPRDPQAPLFIWVLTDHKTGVNNQCIGVAQKMGGRVEVINIEDLEGPKLEQYLKADVHMRGVSQRFPDVVICGSREAEDVAIRIKRIARNKIFNIKLGQPDKFSYDDFDLIANFAIPGHTDTASSHHKDKVMLTDGVAHKVTPELIEEGKKLWEDQFSQLPHPRIAVMIGGNTSPYHQLKPEMAEKLGRDLNEMAKKAHGSLLVTNSRRTPDQATQAFFRHITVPTYVHDWRLSKENPYYGLLGSADAIVVTGDSLSMMDEALVTRKPVYFYPLPEIEMPYHVYRQRQLHARGQARPFDGKLEHWDYTPPDVAQEVANAALTQLMQKQLIAR